MNKKLLQSQIGAMACTGLLAIEPIFGRYDFYLGILLFAVFVAFLSLVGLLIGALSGKISMRDCIEKFSKTPLALLIIYIVGLVVSWCYHSSLFGFWIFLFALELFNRIVSYFYKRCRCEK